MNIFALDKDLNLVATGLPYDNLQWNRRYYTFGTFEMQISEEVYDPSWKYIGSDERDELGMVQSYIPQSGGLVLLGGFFCEKMLDWRAIYPKYHPIIISLGIGEPETTLPAWEFCRDMFNEFKSDLPIEWGGDMSVEDGIYAEAEDDHLGEKMYSILETVEASFKVRFDKKAKGLLFDVWKGKDRTQSQRENAWCVFSKEFGNVASDSIKLDDSDYYNYAIVPCDADEDGIERETLHVDLTNGEPRRDIVIDMRSSSVSNDQTMAQWRESVRQEATEQLLNYAKVEDIDIEPFESGYRTDFDLGDKCDAIVHGKRMESRIIEVNEVFKADGGHEITVGLGNKRISNIKRAVNSI